MSILCAVGRLPKTELTSICLELLDDKKMMEDVIRYFNKIRNRPINPQKGEKQ
jgi:hypothetical protein